MSVSRKEFTNRKTPKIGKKIGSKRVRKFIYLENTMKSYTKCLFFAFASAFQETEVEGLYGHPVRL